MQFNEHIINLDRALAIRGRNNYLRMSTGNYQSAAHTTRWSNVAAAAHDLFIIDIDKLDRVCRIEPGD